MGLISCRFNAKLKESDDFESVLEVVSGEEIKNKHVHSLEIIDHEKIDEENVEKFKHDLNENPDLFILNNLLLSVLFFENYHEDIHATPMSSTELEKNYNEKLRPEAKSCITPDEIFERISKNVKFRPIHGQDKTKSQPIAKRRIFILNDFIEVHYEENENLYSEIDQPNIQVLVQDTKRKGFAKLRVLNPERIKHLEESRRNTQVNFSQISATPSEDLAPPTQNKNLLNVSQETQIKVTPPSPVVVPYKPLTPPSTVDTDSPSDESNTPRHTLTTPMRQTDTPSQENTSKTSTSTDFKAFSDEDSAYEALKSAKTPRLLDRSFSPRGNQDSLPRYCYETKKEEKKPDSVYFTDEDIEIDEDEAEEALYDDVMYVSSRGFMRHFQSQVFPNYLGHLLDFSPKDIDEARSIAGSIFCEQNEQTKCEIIPAVQTTWPLQAKEFMTRIDRRTVTDKRTRVTYQWPNPKMVQKILNFGAVILPRGYVTKGKVQPLESKLEWEFCFPRAERFLESRMTHTQIRCFVYLVTLHKTFIEPKTKYQGLLVEHIRHHMFWECEKNCLNWAEHHLGEKLFQVIESLHEKLATGQMPNFFLREHNLFVDVSRNYLHYAQKVFKNILQFPVNHFVIALRNLRYTSGNLFYPSLNFKELQQILEKSNNLVPEVLNVKSERRDSNASVFVPDKKKRQKMEKEKLNKMKIMRKRDREKKMNARKKAREELLERKESVDSLDLKWKEDSPMENLKKGPILDFFTTHFIKIARKSSQMGPKEQTSFYLKMASYHCKLLQQTYDSDKATKFEANIREIEEELDHKHLTNSIDLPVSSETLGSNSVIDVESDKGLIVESVYFEPRTSNVSLIESDIYKIRTYKEFAEAEYGSLDLLF